MTNLPTSVDNEKVLKEAKEWFKTKIVSRHLVNTKKLTNVHQLMNTLVYLENARFNMFYKKKL